MSVQDVGGVVVQIDPQEWYKLGERLKRADPKLKGELRARIRNAGNFAVDDIRKTLGMPSPDGGPDGGLSRDELARATKVSLSFRGRSAGAKITTSSKGLEPQHQALVKVYNKETFRHPVFERSMQRDSRRMRTMTYRLGVGRADWVEQKGRPYMGDDFAKRIRERAAKEIAAAFAEVEQLLAEKGI